MTSIPAALRLRVEQRARHECEYCRISQLMTFAPHEVDHVIATKHGGATEEENLALACLPCNRHKGTDIASVDPQTGSLCPLFNPRRDRWEEHFEVIDTSIRGRSDTGRTTERLLQLNRPERLVERARLVIAGLWPPGLGVVIDF